MARERLLAYGAEDYPEYHAWLSGLFEMSGMEAEISEEHESSTGLIAAVESGRGVALIQEGFECFSGPRLAIRPLNPAPPPFVVGLAFSRSLKSTSALTFIAAVREGMLD